MRKRLREVPAEGCYALPYHHSLWPDHRVRVDMTTGFARWFVDRESTQSLADLSCGDARIATDLWMRKPSLLLHLGDLVPPLEREPVVATIHAGPIEQTVNEIPNVDLFICSETLEHLVDPDAILDRIRSKARYLVLTTPDGEDTDSNPEHLWGWDAGEMSIMLAEAGWTKEIYASVDLGHYTFQFWGCS